MSRLLMAALLLLLTTVYIVLLAKEDPGYALLSYDGWTIEGTLVLLIGGLSLCIAVIFFALNLLIKTIHLPGILGHWHRNRLALKALKSTHKGYLALAEGDWRSAEHILANSAVNSSMPALNYLGAARAAQHEGARQRRDAYLFKANKSNPEADLAIGLTQAELQLNEGQAEEALVNLEHLHKIAADNPRVVKMQVVAYQQLQNWQALESLLPQVRHHNLLSDEQMEHLEDEIALQHIKRAEKDSDLNALNLFWDELPQRVRHRSSMVVLYCATLLTFHEHDRAAKLVCEALIREWHDDLVALYGHIRESNPVKQLETAETWLCLHQDNPTLLLTLGLLSRENQLWGKARDYLQQSIALLPSTEAYHVLGELYEGHLQETDKAMDCYRKGLCLAGQLSSAKSNES